MAIPSNGDQSKKDDEPPGNSRLSVSLVESPAGSMRFEASSEGLHGVGDLLQLGNGSRRADQSVDQAAGSPCPLAASRLTRAGTLHV